MECACSDTPAAALRHLSHGAIDRATPLPDTLGAQRLTSCNPIMTIKAEIQQALEAHAAWRARFKDFLGGKAALDEAAIGDTHGCRFGNWLDNEGYRLMPESRRDEVRAAHDEFHKIADGIVQKIHAKQFAEAKADLARDGPLNQASARLTDALIKARLYEP